MSPALSTQSGNKRPVSLRLSAKARAILATLAEEHGISQAGVVEQLLRRAGREHSKTIKQL